MPSGPPRPRCFAGGPGALITPPEPRVSFLLACPPHTWASEMGFDSQRQGFHPTTCLWAPASPPHPHFLHSRIEKKRGPLKRRPRSLRKIWLVRICFHLVLLCADFSVGQPMLWGGGMRLGFTLPPVRAAAHARCTSRGGVSRKSLPWSVSIF